MNQQPGNPLEGASPLQKGFAVIWMIASLLYTASPIDAVPDAIPVVGWLDDIGLLLTAAMNVVQQFAKNQDSAMVKILKYAKWFMILMTVMVALLFGGLIAAIIALIVK
ncbi:MAG: DUF1232 domain-containing protein [Fibrobacter sp.]|nr:DUF1232 domain-containing protein [Fibrobacter sp.]